MRRALAPPLVALAALAAGCGSGASRVPQLARAVSRVGPYRFVGQPVVMRWNFQSYQAIPPPSYDVHFRLSGPLHVGDPYRPAAPVPVRIDGSTVYVTDKSRRGNCYYAAGGDTPVAKRALDAARIGQRVIVSVALSGHGVHGTLRASVPIQLRRHPKPTDNADGVIPNLWTRFGCPGGAPVELVQAEVP
jgi:hypothetical protein